MDSTSIPFRSHTALLLAAALPYLQPTYRHPVELALKFLEFSETMKLYREFHLPGTDSPSPLQNNEKTTSGEPGIMGLISRFILDPEGLLNNLSNVCTGKEKDLVGMLLNLMRAKNFYDNYGDILSSFMSFDTPEASQEPQETPAYESAAPEDSFSMPNMADMASMLSGGDLTSMLNKEQTDTLNLLKNLLDAE